MSSSPSTAYASRRGRERQQRLGDRLAVGVLADDPVGQDDDRRDPVGVAPEQELEEDVAAGHDHRAVRQAAPPRRRTAPGRPTAASRRRRRRRSRGRPEVVLVERVALDLERVVDPDRLVGDLLAVPVDRELRREVAGLAGLEEARRLERRGSSRRGGPGEPIGWTVSEPPSTSSSGCSSPNLVVTAAATMNRISPRWVKQRRQLRVLVAIAVEIGASPSAVGLLADA